MIDPQVEELLEEAYVREAEASDADSQAARASDFEAAIVETAVTLGYIRPDSSRKPAWALTDAGLDVARGVVRRHRLAERLLCDVLAVGNDDLDQDACRFEHILREGLDEKVCALLGHPQTCPHGKGIPPGDCCRKAQADAIKEVAPLCDGKAGQDGTVAYLSTRDQREVQKLMAIGVLPGVRIRLIRRFPSFVFQVGYSQFTVDRQLAKMIVVHWREQ